MIQALRALLIALFGGVLLCILLIVLGVPRLPMLLASEAALVVLFCLFFWKPRWLREVAHGLVEKVRRWA